MTKRECTYIRTQKANRKYGNIVHLPLPEWLMEFSQWLKDYTIAEMETGRIKAREQFYSLFDTGEAKWLTSGQLTRKEYYDRSIAKIKERGPWKREEIDN